MVRLCTEADFAAIYAIVNDAAQAYRGHIPADRWHEPYMPEAELRHELDAGVVFWGWEQAGKLVGVMGLQDVADVALIRHAYVATAARRNGIGGKLLEFLLERTSRPVLIGTWAAATWAVRFYEKHGFRVVPPAEKERLLRKYWRIPDRQIETSVVLADARWPARAAEDETPGAPRSSGSRVRQVLERRVSSLAPRRAFARRFALSFAIGLGLIAASLVLGMLGYRFIEGQSWLDAFLNAAMILSGMGPITTNFQTDAGKLFAGLFALYAGFAVVVATGIVFVPLVHRVLHRFYLNLERRE